MAIRREHRVTFYSPGTMFSEVTSKPIPAWDTRMAVGMAEGIVERHDARPYGFRFETFMVGDPVPDGEGRVLEVKARLDKSSGMHFLGGSVRTFAQVMADDRPEANVFEIEIGGLIIEVSRRGLPKITIMDSDLQHQIESGQGIGELDSLYELVRRTVLRVDDALDVLLDALPEEGTS
jgi:hypothetical protein